MLKYVKGFVIGVFCTFMTATAVSGAGNESIAPVLEEIRHITLADGRIAMDTDECFKDKTTDEVWQKMKAQIFYAYADGQEEYFVFKDGIFTHLPGGYVFDGGTARFSVSDLDNDGVYELLSIFHAGSGMDYQLLACYIPGKDVASNFGTVNNRYNFAKTDDQNVYIEFMTGEKAKISLVNENGIYRIEVSIPPDLSDGMRNSLTK